MVNESIRIMLNEKALVFDNPSFDEAIIGQSFEGQAIYCLNKMIEILMVDESLSYEDAIEFIEYNTIRTIPYMGTYAPLILEDSYSIISEK